MNNTLTKKALVRTAEAIKADKKVRSEIVDSFLNHKFQESTKTSKVMMKMAAGITFFFASVLVVFPEVGEKLIEILPSYFLLSERVARSLDFVWGLVGKPVGKQHLMYHLPNIIIYAFGVAGLRKLLRRLNRNNWKDLVEDAQDKLRKTIEQGTAQFAFAPGFSVLFTGEGDRVARSLVADNPTVGVTLSSKKQSYTSLWGQYAVSEGDEGFSRVLGQFNAEDAGEYVLFPVLDEHLFLPGKYDFDMAPHRVDVAVRRIRDHEKEMGWEKKRILIVGDLEHESNFITASRDQRTHSHPDAVSLRTIAEDYENVTVIDPTDTVIRRIIEIADGNQILFRSSDLGVEKYSEKFYRRLSLLGYKPTKEQTLTVGYDISDLETEQQLVSEKHSGYLPVILTRDIFDELIKNRFQEDAILFVPRLVKRELQDLVAQH